MAHSAPSCASLGRNRAAASDPVASSSATTMSDVLIFGPVMRRLERRIDQAPTRCSTAARRGILQQSRRHAKEFPHRAANAATWVGLFLFLGVDTRVLRGLPLWRSGLLLLLIPGFTLRDLVRS